MSSPLHDVPSYEPGQPMHKDWNEQTPNPLEKPASVPAEDVAVVPVPVKHL